MLTLFRNCLMLKHYPTFRILARLSVPRPIAAPIANTKRLLIGLVFNSQHSNMPKTVHLHSKARRSPYPNSTVNRVKVDDNHVPWPVAWKEYVPVDFTAPKVLAGPVWADKHITKKADAKKMKFNKVDGTTNRKSYEKDTYEIEEDGRPRNPCGRTGLRGRGELGKWGPNHAADPIVTRWKRDSLGEIVKSKSDRPILQFIAIERRDNGEWAIPGGMVDAGEKVSVTLKREFSEEAMNSLGASEKELKTIKKEVDKLFKHGQEVYRGYVDDPRNTDNSWMETIAVNFHDNNGNSVGKFNLHAGDDAAAVHWMDIGSEVKLYASHKHFIEAVTKLHNAHW